MDYGDAFMSGLRGSVNSIVTPLIEASPLNQLDTIIDIAFKKYDKKTASFLKKHGSGDIETLVVRRAPVQEWINRALNVLSVGKWDESRAQFEYDKMFHVSLIVNGQYAIQRVGRVSIAMKDPDRPGSEFRNVPLSPYGESLTMNQMLQTTLRRVGEDTFFKYDSFRNNCQNFVYNILVANNLMTPELESFILQPLDKLLEQQPGYLSAVAKSVTDIGHIFGLGKPSDKPRGINYAFSEDDIRAFCGDIPILRYPELANMTDPSELFRGNVGAALLFLTDGPSSGHWIAVLDKPDHYEVFDSFGTAIDGQRKWLDRGNLLEFGQTAPLLSKLLKGEGKKVIHNTKKLQKDDADTCGRYVAARIVRASTTLPDFIEELTANGRSPDVNVTLMTQLPHNTGAEGGQQKPAKLQKMIGGYGQGAANPWLKPGPPPPPAPLPGSIVLPGLPHLTHIVIHNNVGNEYFQVPVNFNATTIEQWYNAVKAALPPQYADLADQNFYLRSVYEDSIIDQWGYTTDIDPAADSAGEGDGDVDSQYAIIAFMGGQNAYGQWGIQPNQMWFQAEFGPSPRV
jgi:hypothetical protein